MFVSIGNSRMDKKFNCTDMTYEDFVSRLSKTKYTAETMEQYRKMPKGQQDNIKDVGGFVLGKLKGGRRKKDCVISRSAITLDMDYGTPGIIDELEMFFDMKMVVYSTHKHTPEKPRLRIIIFLTRDVTPDEYGAVSRMLASDIGIELFDDSTYEPSRLMYWPSTSSDGEYVFQEIEGNEVDPDEVLSRYKDWHDVSAWPVSNRQASLWEAQTPRADSFVTLRATEDSGPCMCRGQENTIRGSLTVSTRSGQRQSICITRARSCS